MKQIEPGLERLPNVQSVVTRVLERSDDKKTARITAFVNLLRALRARGMLDFSVAAVGRECERAGILKTQSIRNKTGSDYKSILEAFQIEVGAATGLKAKDDDGVKKFILEVEDVQIRSRLLELTMTVSRHVEEISRLKHGYKFIAHPKTGLSVSGAGSAPTKKSNVDPTPILRFLDSDWLETHGLEIKSGAIYREDEVRLTPDGFVDSLRQLLSLAG